MTFRLSRYIGLSYVPITQEFAYKSLKLREMDNCYAPVLQVRFQEAICYQLWMGPRFANKSNDNIYEVKKLAYSGDVTVGSRKRMRRSINLLLQLSPERIIYNPVSNSHHPFTVSFITLTVSDVTIRDHRQVMAKCLAPFLQWLRGKGVKHYIWKAELQKRSQIHYHITTNKFIHYAEIKKVWNKYQKSAGYLDNYARENKHFNANSTDVHAVKNIRDIEAYLVKYMVKQASAGEQEKAAKKFWEAGLQYVPETTHEKIDGKVWDCSSSLSRPLFTTFIGYEIAQIIDDAVQQGTEIKDLEQCSIIKKAGIELLDAYSITEYTNFIHELNTQKNERNAKNLQQIIPVSVISETGENGGQDKSNETARCAVRGDDWVQGALSFER